MYEFETNERNFLYSRNYKKLLVEHFSINDNRENLHYGKCAVIGYCTVDCGLYFLGNVRITSTNPNRQLCDNTLRVLLLPIDSNEPLPVNKFVKVLGESVLYDKKRRHFECGIPSIPCTTSLDVFRTRCATNGQLNDDYHTIVTDNYVPAIKVHGILPISNAHEIVNYDLRLKLIKGR